MIELSRRVKELHHKVRLNAGFRSDLSWWGCFLPIWNGHVQWLVLLGVNHGLSLLRMLPVAGDAVPIPLPESGFS